MKNRLVLTLLALMPFFAYGSNTQPINKTKLLMHLQTVKKEITISLNKAQTKKNNTISTIRKRDPKNLQKIEIIITEHFESDLAKRFLLQLTEHVFSEIYNNMKSFSKSIDTCSVPNLQHDGDELQNKLDCLMDTFEKDLHKQNPQDDNLCWWSVAISELQMFSFKIIIRKMTLEKIDKKIKELKKQA